MASKINNSTTADESIRVNTLGTRLINTLLPMQYYYYPDKVKCIFKDNITRTRVLLLRTVLLVSVIIGSSIAFSETTHKQEFIEVFDATEAILNRSASCSRISPVSINIPDGLGTKEYSTNFNGNECTVSVTLPGYYSLFPLYYADFQECYQHFTDPDTFWSHEYVRDPFWNADYDTWGYTTISFDATTGTFAYTPFQQDDDGLVNIAEHSIFTSSCFINMTYPEDTILFLRQHVVPLYSADYANATCAGFTLYSNGPFLCTIFVKESLLASFAWFGYW